MNRNRQPSRRDPLWQTPSISVGLIIAVIGLGIASAALADTPSRVAVPFLGSLAIVGVTLVAGRHRSPDDIAFLGGAMLVGLGVRFLLLAFIHQSVGPYVFAPDAATYEGFGAGMVAFWRGVAPLPARLEGTLQVGYYAVNAGMFVVFGDGSTVAPAMLNIFLGVVLAIPVYHLMRLILPQQRRVARFATVMAVFFPSLTLWSVLNVREAPAVLMVASAAFFFTALSKEVRPRYLVGILVALTFLSLLREYLTPLLLISGLSGVVMAQSRNPFRAFVVGGGALLVVVVGLRTFGLGSALVVEPDFERVSLLREAMTQGAGSALGTEVETTTLGGALQFLPIGITRFLLAPYPWSIGRGSLLQGLTLPEVLVWYALLPFFLRGIYLAFKHDASSFTVVAAMFVVISTAYGLVEGNVGTAYRHRAQVVPLAFVFMAVGLADYLAVRAQRQAKARAIRRRVGQGPPPPVDRDGRTPREESRRG